jgi:saccharopine dehydrogenase-like NADP-dependent oxidoreductase
MRRREYTMKVFVFGCGEMGQEAVQDLYNSGKFEEIVVGTRTVEKARELGARLTSRKTKLSIIPLDLNRPQDLAVLLTGFDVAVNCAGPNYKYEVLVARAAISAGVDLVDINDDYETTFQMLELDEAAKRAGVTVVLGLGASPGINNVLVRAAANQLDDIEEIHTAWVMSASDPGGLALSYHLLYSLSDKALTCENGGLVGVRSFVDGKERIQFPDPVGALDVYHIGHPEPITLSRCFPGAKMIDDKATFTPPLVNDWIIDLGKKAREAKGPILVKGRPIEAMDYAASEFRKKCLGLKNVPKAGALRVMVKGRKASRLRKVFFSSAGRIAQGTGIPVSIGAQMLAAGKVKGPGVLAPEECIEPNEFLYEVLNRKIGKLNGWVEEQDQA